MAKLSAAERQAKIVELLSDNGTMKVVDLAEYFQVSRETIRRDLIALNEAGTVKKWFGGAVPVHNFNILSVDTRMMENPDVKMQLCEKALEYIPEHAVLFIDTGSTALCMAKLLRSRSGYTIITSSIPAINELVSSGNQLIATGGSINPQTMSMVGSQTIELLESIKMDVAILGSSGFDRHKGPTTNGFDDGQTKRVVLQNAQTNIVLADSKKATYSSLRQYACWRDIDYLVTDAGLPEETQRELGRMTTVVLA